MGGRGSQVEGTGRRDRQDTQAVGTGRGTGGGVGGHGRDRESPGDRQHAQMGN